MKGALCAASDLPEHCWDVDAGRGDHVAAIAVCEGCPVRLECLLEARADRSLSGVWGGVLFGGDDGKRPRRRKGVYEERRSAMLREMYRKVGAAV